MRTTLAIDDDVLGEARQIAAAEGRSLGSVISSLARRALAPAGIRVVDGLPTFDVAADAAVISPDMVARAMDDE
ncbi:MAG: DUF2191 domain-containing protein [Nocardioides sp.]